MGGEYRLGQLNGRWVVTWWEQGRRRRRRLKAASQGEAQREAIDVIRQATARAPATTVSDLWQRYREEKAGRRVADAMYYEWKAIGPHFGHLRPDQITVQMSRDYTAARRAHGKGDGTIWTELGHLRTVLRWAYGSQAPHIERPPKPAPKERYLSQAEIDQLLATDMPHHIRLAILLMLSTAARVGAIQDLTWDRVDFEHGQINLRTDPTGPRKGRAVVPMNAGLRAALSQAREAAMTDYVIEWAGEPVGTIRKAFNRAVADAGLADVTPHVLRHTAAVHLAAAGVPMSRISQYLGHTSTAVTERVYARFAPDHLRQEAEILDFATFQKRGA